jgi:hypothetical protein
MGDDSLLGVYSSVNVMFARGRREVTRHLASASDPSLPHPLGVKYIAPAANSHLNRTTRAFSLVLRRPQSNLALHRGPDTQPCRQRSSVIDQNLNLL